MRAYQDLLQTILTNGYEAGNRTGVPTIALPGYHMSFNCGGDAMPMLTIRKMPFKAPIGEMIGFIKGCSTVQQFKELKCNYWDANGLSDGQDIHGNVVPNPWLKSPHRHMEGDLGRIYGVQWRDFGGSFNADHLVGIDQLKNAIHAILYNPTSRRIVVSAYNPMDLDKMALPPCHLLFNVMIDVPTRTMHLGFYMRSNDVYLGLPSNLVEYAFLLNVLAHATGYYPGTLQYFGMDVHLYKNSIDNARILIGRETNRSPRLKFLRPFEGARNTETVLNWLEGLHPDDFELEGYVHYEDDETTLPPVKMAV